MASNANLRQNFLIALLRILDDCSHSSPFFRSFAFVCVMAKDGEVAFWFQPSAMSSLWWSGAVIETKWPTP
jgi:hypothetical protein